MNKCQVQTAKKRGRKPKQNIDKLQEQIRTFDLDFSKTILATFTCLSAGSSKVDDTTSAFTLLAMSVTSSGLSSIKRIIK